MKYPSILKKSLERDREWETIKEILGLVINTHRGNLALSSKRRLELISLLEIPNSQRRISVKKLEKLIGKLRSTHLTKPGAISQFYAI